MDFVKGREEESKEIGSSGVESVGGIREGSTELVQSAIDVAGVLLGTT